MGFKRLHVMPRHIFNGATLASLTPRGRWLLARSEERYLRRSDAYGLAPLLVGEVGRIENFRFILSGA